jgi:hypothetical protein
MIKIHKILLACSLPFLFIACEQNKDVTSTVTTIATNDSVSLHREKQTIHDLLDSFNVAAARADFNGYFNYYTEDAIFIGTDATENWNKKEFMEWARPAFEKGKTWNFTALERNIYFDLTGTTAWFDELLDTQMKICRGSGVLVKKGGEWKVQQYVLSMTVPNSQVDAAIKIKEAEEDSLIKVMRQ